MSECQDKKLVVLHDAVRGCNANLNKALVLLGEIHCEPINKLENSVFWFFC